MSQPRPWTTGEIDSLREYARRGEGASGIAERLSRSVESVRQAAKRHRISLRREGSTAGLLLGQPRGVSWARFRSGELELRAEILDGRIDPAVLEAQVRLIADARDHADLCPACTARPVAPGPTGLCRVCHRRALTDAINEEREYRDANRAYDTARQHRHRERTRT